MSLAKRLIFGASALWAGIALTMFHRVLLVPLFLATWSVERYGEYLAILAIAGFQAIPGRAFETVLGRECLRLGADREVVLRLLGGGVILSFLVESLTAIFVAVCFYSFKGLLFSEFANLQHSIYLIVLVVFMVRTCVDFPGAVFCNLLSYHGLFANTAWLGLLSKILLVMVPVVVLFLRGGPFEVVIAELLTPVITAPIGWFFIRKWAKPLGLWHFRYDVKSAFRIFLLSTINIILFFFDYVKTLGLRVILAPLAGGPQLAAFVTMRTGANFAMQSMQTITGPFLPEIMRFISQKDRENTKAMLACIWCMIVFVMAPFTIVLQLFAEPIFNWWTQFKIAFQPITFALISSSVLLSATSQPSSAIILGNNLMRLHAVASAVSGIVVVVLLFTLFPVFGLTGVGLSLLVGEGVSVAMLAAMARKWLQDAQLEWPGNCYALTVVVVANAFLTTLLMGVFISNTIVVGAIGFSLHAVLACLFWNAFPTLLRVKLYEKLENTFGNIVRRFRPIVS